MKELILFLMAYIFVFLLYELFIVRPRKRKRKKKKEYKDPVEIQYLVNRYHFNMKKIPYNQLLQIVALVSSFDISLSVSLILLCKNFVLEIIVGLISIVGTILISYHLVYLFYRKKGMIKDE